MEYGIRVTYLSRSPAAILSGVRACGLVLTPTRHAAMARMRWASSTTLSSALRMASMSTLSAARRRFAVSCELLESSTLHKACRDGWMHESGCLASGRNPVVLFSPLAQYVAVSVAAFATTAFSASANASAKTTMAVKATGDEAVGIVQHARNRAFTPVAQESTCGEPVWESGWNVL